VTYNFSTVTTTIDAVHLVKQAYSEAAVIVRPSSLRGASTISLPQLTLDDVIGLEQVKKVLLRLLSFYDPSKKALMQRFKLKSPGGALLYGPPGNSKTRLVLACASTMRLPVISLSVADIYSPYVGDAEAEIRRSFALARQSAPCIMFLDEVDALVTDRSVESFSTGAESRVLATMLTEMDGLAARSGEEGIVVLGATNRVDAIDAALLRKVLALFQ
jgi:SpoVK/Ycf46/Vps4 family AAA+-type ATPase